MKKTTLLLLMSFVFVGMINAQEKTTLNVKDLDSDIEKYIEKNHKGYQPVEAYKYPVVYEMKIQKAGVLESLLFNQEGKFMHKKTDADKPKLALQTRFSMALDEVESDISKYIKKTYEGSKLTEAFKYDEVVSVKIKKGAEMESLVFDKEGNFLMKQVPAVPVTPAPKIDSAAVKTPAPATDSVQAKPEMKDETAPADSTK